MPGPLANQTHEKFAQLVAGGMNKSKAFLAARDPNKPPLKNDHSVRQSATNLINIPAVKARIAELQERIADKTVAKAADVRAAAQKYTTEAIETLASVMRDKQAPTSARVAASTGLLDRGWGKAPQSVDMTVRRADPEQFSDADLASYLEADSCEDTATQTDDPAIVH